MRPPVDEAESPIRLPSFCAATSTKALPSAPLSPLSLLYSSYVYLMHFHRAGETVSAGYHHSAAQLVKPCPSSSVASKTQLPFRARRRVGVAIFPSMPRVVPHPVILPRCLEGLNVFCFVFFSCLSPAAYCSGKSRRNKAVAQFSRKNGTSIGSAQDR